MLIKKYFLIFQSSSSASDSSSRPSSHCRNKSSPDPLGLQNSPGVFLMVYFYSELYLIYKKVVLMFYS